MDRAAQGGSRPEHVLLPDEILERRRPKTNRKRRVLRLALARGFAEEVGHARSMLRAMSEAEDVTVSVASDAFDG